MNRTNYIDTHYPIREPCLLLNFLGGYLMLLWLFGITFNGKVVWVFLRKKKLRQSPSHIFILGLITADMIAILFELPISIVSTLSCRSVMLV